MLKKYTAKTQVCVNIVMPGGKSLHVSFTSVTGGSSVFYTSDENVQTGLEHHYKFGKLFKLEDMIDETKSISPTPVDTPDTGEENSEDKLTEIVVSCPDDAKDYLSEKFGASRTKLRSIKAIKDTAATFGIVFNGI